MVSINFYCTINYVKLSGLNPQAFLAYDWLRGLDLLAWYWRTCLGSLMSLGSAGGSPGSWLDEEGLTLDG